MCFLGLILSINEDFESSNYRTTLLIVHSKLSVSYIPQGTQRNKSKAKREKKRSKLSSLLTNFPPGAPSLLFSHSLSNMRS